MVLVFRKMEGDKKNESRLAHETPHAVQSTQDSPLDPGPAPFFLALLCLSPCCLALALELGPGKNLTADLQAGTQPPLSVCLREPCVAGVQQQIMGRLHVGGATSQAARR